MNAPVSPQPADDLLERLIRSVRELHSAVIAFSGGADSTLLLHAAKMSGIPVLAVTAFSEIMPGREIREAVEIADNLGIPHRVIRTDELADPLFVRNSPERCFCCKDSRLGMMKAIARTEGYEALADGSNLDDFSEWRPGLRALRLHGARSPLKEAGLTKQDVRNISRRIGIDSWEKPSSPCLCTRIPFGTPITRERLVMIGCAEDFLRSLGFSDIRVRAHDTLARIEVDGNDIERICRGDVRESVASHFRNLGFSHISIDLEGRRSGSLNPPLEQAALNSHE